MRFRLCRLATPTPTPWPVLPAIRQALAADAPRAFRRRCWSAITAQRAAVWHWLSQRSASFVAGYMIDAGEIHEIHG